MLDLVLDALMHNTTKSAASALILGPALLAAGSAAWFADAAQLRAILTFWAIVLIGVGVHGIVLRRLAEPAPRAHAILGLMLAAGVAAGAGFAVELGMTEAFGVERLIDTGKPTAIFMLNIPGLMFPASLLGVGIMSWRLKTLPSSSAILLAVAAATFPISRIGEIAGVALVSDLLLVAATAPVGIATLLRRAAAISPVAQPAIG